MLTQPGSIALQERPLPVPGPLEVLVELTAVGVCGSDIHYYEHGRIGSSVVTGPLILGHECAGVVAAIGSEVTKHEVGTRVAVEPGVPCGRCRECRSGRYNLCADVVFLATPPVDGAFRGFIAIHEDFVFALPDELSEEAGALIEPLSVGIWACQRGGVTAGQRVLIAGAGPIGLLATQAARAFGATEVEVSDVNEHRLAAATRMGATRVLRAGADSAHEADVFIECCGHPAALASGIAALRPGGTAVVVGIAPDGRAEVPLSLLQTRELWLTGTFRYANTYPTAIALARAGIVDPAAIVSHHYRLEETEQALRIGREDPTSVKAIVHPSSGRGDASSDVRAG